MQAQHIEKFLWVSSLHIYMDVNSAKEISDREALRDYSVKQENEAGEKNV